MDINLAPDVVVTGTMVWYLHVCPREVWFLSRNITPFQYHRRLEFGRELHKHHSDEVPLSLEGMKLDKYSTETGVVIEVKSTSRHLESARAQLKYYLVRLREVGVEAKGEVYVPEEGVRERVEDFTVEEVMRDVERIRQIVTLESPPPRKWIRYCRRCAYRGLCWAEG